MASTNIRAHLLGNYKFVENQDLKEWNPKFVNNLYSYSIQKDECTINFSLIGIDDRTIFLDEKLNADELLGDLIIFASRHRSESQKPALLYHTPGNFNDDVSAGGLPFRLARSSGLTLYYFFKYLTQFSNERNFDFPVNQEVTHHGPTSFIKPIAFIELGSSEVEWNNQIGGKIIADTIMQTGIDLGKFHYQNGKWDSKKIKICIGVGGTHYMPNFTRYIDKGFTFAHTIPKYKVNTFNMELIEEIKQRTVENIDYWVVDWKGLNSADKQIVMPLLEKTGIPIKKSKQLGKINQS
jgi:D-aminoacyl-tRNA deacylase